jgi:Cu+-exporting ATPase
MTDTAPQTGQRIDFDVSGMTCAACVRRVERAASKVEGVLSSTVNLATERASIQLSNPTSDRIEAVRKAISDAGYPTRLTTQQSAPSADLGQDRDLIWAMLLSLPILVVSMGPMLVPGGMEWMMARMSMQRWNQALWFLATAVQFIPGWRFYRHGWSSLRSWNPDMNLLVALGTTAAYVYSTIVTWTPWAVPPSARHVYFESSAVVIAFLLLGKVLEQRSKKHSRSAIEALGQLQPRIARRVQSDGIQSVDIQQVALGDILEIHAGEAIPIDGVIVDGTSYVDESMVTGEPIPRVRSVGDEIIGGTVNGNGMLRARVTAIGPATFLSRITAMVVDAQSSKPPIQHAVDRVVARFVPAVLAIAFLTAIAWLIFGGDDRWTHALVHCVAVLIIACPCAMGLATPISTLVGTGRAAELGILFRSGEAFENLASIERIAFDKTGTLTEGKPTRDHVTPLQPWTERQLLELAVSAARTSQHPVSKALVASFPDADGLLHARTSEHVPGSGVIVDLSDGTRVHLGSPTWFEHLGLVPHNAQPLLSTAMASGKTLVCVAVDGVLAGWVTISDRCKAEGKSAIAQLKQLGIDSWILSGDHPLPVERLASQLGIEHAQGNLLPEQKAEALRAWQREGVRVAFVGDGINDAPALASAQVGMGIGTGTQVAISAADVVLISGNLHGVSTSVRLARALMRNIRMNLLWAFAYNILLIPVAAGLLVPINGWSLNPMFGAIAMSLSSVLVVFNALRLRAFDRMAKD